MPIILIWLCCILPVEGYFNGAMDYTTGKNGYTGRDIYLIIGRDNWWLKPQWSWWKNDYVDNINRFSLRVAFEKELYTLAFDGGITPKKYDYTNLSFGSDIIFSLTSRGSFRRRLAGYDHGFDLKSSQGVNRIDLGAGAKVISHKYYDIDSKLNEIDLSLFGGVMLFSTEISLNYTLYNYDRTSLAKTKSSISQRVIGINSFLPAFLKSNLNIQLNIPHSTILSPYIGYNRVKSENNDTMDVILVGGYADLNMVGVNLSFQTYKGDITGNKRENYITVSMGVKF